MREKLKVLSKQVLNILDKNKLTISTAESCTGGLIAEYITSHSGSSNVFKGGFVTYSNMSKIKLLNVNKNTILHFGAVSKETVNEMSNGAKNILKSDIAIAVSGIAGPNGGSIEKPVGLVHHSITYQNSHKHTKQIYLGDRENIRNKTAETVFKMILEIVI